MPWAFFSVCLTIAATGEDTHAEGPCAPAPAPGRRGAWSPRTWRCSAARSASAATAGWGRGCCSRSTGATCPRAGMDRDWEYTDWDEVDAFARRLLAAVRAPDARVTG